MKILFNIVSRCIRLDPRFGSRDRLLFRQPQATMPLRQRRAIATLATVRRPRWMAKAATKGIAWGELPFAKSVMCSRSSASLVTPTPPLPPKREM